MDVRVLGPLEAGPPSDPIRIAAPKQRTLLAALALTPGRAVSLDALTEALWGEDPPASAGKLLQTYVSQLRKVLPEAAVVTRAPGYAFDIDPEHVDAARFTRLVTSGSHARTAGSPHDAVDLLRQALDLWRGDALSDVGPAPLFDAEVARLSELRLRALEEQYAARLELGEAAELVAPLQGLAAEHPLREGLQHSLVLALYLSGRQAEALATYDAVRTTLRDELGLDPGPALRELHARLLRQDTGLATERQTPTARLPTPLTSTIGRESELAQLEAMLADPAHRLVTLTGPGGSGKTRLALVTALRVADRYPDGAVVVALDAVREPPLALATIAAAVGVRETGDDPLATLGRELARKQILVVLDNLEQVVSVGPALTELLGLVPGLTFLATSRVLLAVTGESAFPVPPLALPSGDDRSDARDSPAVALFCERARLALPTFEITEANAADIAELCRRLDGLPLAIELAAAQSRTLSPAQLLERLQSRLDAPGPGQRDRPTRHHSLRSALDGSYELLTPAARTLFAALSVFAGGFDLAGAEAVSGATPATLGELIDSSLVQVAATAVRRFRMLETIRDYAAEHVPDDAIRDRHAAYFLDLAEAANAEIDGAQQAIQLALLDREHDNILAALTQLRVAGKGEGEVRLVVALARFWYIRGYLTESRAHLSAALERSAALEPHLRADALRKFSANAILRGSYAEALSLAEQALAVYDEMADQVGRARSLSNIGAISHALGEHEDSASSLDAAITLARSLAADRVLALALNNRGDLCLTLGEFDEATRMFEESRALLEAQGDSANVARSLLNLALSALGRSALDEARRLIPQSLELCAELGDAEDIAWCLLARAALESRVGSPEQAALLLGAAESVLRSIDAVLKPYERSVHASTTAALIDALGDADFELTRARGSRLRLDEAVAVARS